MLWDAALGGDRASAARCKKDVRRTNNNNNICFMKQLTNDQLQMISYVHLQLVTQGWAYIEFCCDYCICEV